MQTTSSTHLPLRPRPTAAPSLVTAVGAFALLVFRLTGERDVVVLVGDGDGACERVRLAIDSRSTISDVLDAIPTRTLRRLAFHGVVRLAWSEGSARLSIVLRLPSLALDLAASEQNDLFATDRPMHDVARCFRLVVDAARARPSSKLAEISLVDAAERRLLLDGWSRPNPRPDLLDDDVLHELFVSNAHGAPDAIAVEHGDRTISYGALHRRARRFASALRARGIGRGSFVALQLPRSIEAYAAMLGALMAGAAYVPLDPETPIDRVRYVLSDVGAAVLVSTTPLDDAPCPSLRVGDLNLEDPTGRASLGHDDFVDPALADDVAYVIYTSGSSGRPKGVAITHRSARHLVRVERDLFAPTRSDRVFQGFSLAFDAAVEEVWLAFAAGATLVVGDKEIVLGDLAAFLRRARVTIFSCVPTLLSTASDDLPSVRVLIVGGEACAPELVRRFARHDRPLFNTYGPTEATVIATCSRLVPGAKPTIGSPIANYTAWVLDPDGNPAPIGVAGEICLGGVGLARGYVGSAAASTATKFVTHPHADRPGAPPIVYRTGDRGRFLPSGEIEFLGRIDDQVKIRGYRVEMGEIEAALLALPSIAQAAVSVRDERIAAHVVTRAGRDLDEASLRSALRRTLPAYMLPATIDRHEALPLLPSGKIDRKSLPPPKPRAVARDVPTGDPIEAKIVRVWRSLFGVESIARDAHFFDDLGGHSLLAARMISELRRDPGLSSVSVLDAYRHPTPARLAAHLSHASPRSQPRVSARPSVDRWRHAAFCVARALASYIVFAAHVAQWIGPFFSFVLLRRHDARLAAVVALVLLVALPPAMLLFVVACKRALGRVPAGRHPLWGLEHLRVSIVERLIDLAPVDLLVGTPLLPLFCRAMGARIGANVHLATASIGSFDHLEIADDATIGVDATLSAHHVEDGALVVAPIRIGARCTLGTRATVSAGATMQDDARLDDLSLLPSGAILPRGETWSGSPARRSGVVRQSRIARPGVIASFFRAFVQSTIALLVPLIVAAPLLPALVLLGTLERRSSLALALGMPLAAALFVLLFALEIVALKWIVVGRVTAGTRPVVSFFELRQWIVERLLALSLDVMGSAYATLWIVPWLRLLGVKLGKNAEVSTVMDLAPDLVSVGDESFLADCVSLGAPRIDRGFVTRERTSVGNRSFVGNSSVVASGTSIVDDGLVGCITRAPTNANHTEKPGTSWIGSPPIVLPRRETRATFGSESTYRPTRALVARRLAIELARVVLPPTGSIALGWIVVRVALAIVDRASLFAALGSLPLLAFAAGVLAAAVVVATKWLLLGRIRPGERPLWSTFVWMNELVTALQDELVDPLLLRPLLGTPIVAWFFRALGATIGRRVHLATTCFTEWDLVRIGDDVSLDEDCTIQTHLFEDRVMKVSSICLENGCFVGANSIVLYDTRMRAGSSLGPLSLLMKGETLPAGTRWMGCPATAARSERS